MRKILAIAWKDARLRFASWSEWLFFIILPVFFTIILAFYVGSISQSDNRNAFLVVNEDQSKLAEEMIVHLDQSESVRPVVLSMDEAQEAFEARDYPAMLIIPLGFEATLRTGEKVSLDLETDPYSTNALAAMQAIAGVAYQVSQALAVAGVSLQEAQTRRPFADSGERAAYFDQSLKQANQLIDSAPQRVVRKQSTIIEPVKFDANAFASVGQLIIWVFIPLLGTSELFAFERSIGTFRRLLTTPTKKPIFLLGAISGQLIISFIQMVLLIIFGLLVFKVPWGNSVAGLVLTLVSFALASVAFGIMLGTFVKTTGQANGVSIALGMTLGLLGGCMMPLENFPKIVRTVVHVFPTTWAMEAMSAMTMRSAGVQEILPHIGVLLGFAVVFFLVGVRRFRYE